MSASMKVYTGPLKELSMRINDPSIRGQINGISRERPVAALIGQAIADNFEREGPGWAPLKLREGKPLQKTGLLKKSVTTPGAKGNVYHVTGNTIEWGTNLIYAGIHQTGGVVSVKNSKFLFIPLTKKAQDIGPQKSKAAQKKSGLVAGKDMVFKKSVTVPARPYLNISEAWKKMIFEYVIERMGGYIQSRLAK